MKNYHGSLSTKIITIIPHVIYVSKSTVIGENNINTVYALHIGPWLQIGLTNPFREKVEKVIELTIEKTNRGFKTTEFDDLYGLHCSLQKSSLAFKDAIWFGVDDTEPKILIEGKGWQDYKLPDEVLIHSRMHLSREQVINLLPKLVKFVNEGDL